MIVTVSFPVRNDVRIYEPFPIRIKDRTYFIETDGTKMVGMGVRFSGASAAAPPTIKYVENAKVKAHIEDGLSGRYVLLAERDLRSWQSVVAPVAPVHLDFDSPKIKFEREKGDEERSDQILSWSTTLETRPKRALDDFSIAGRAFLAIELGEPLIEVMAFYLKAQGALAVERFVDAYNDFYLFLETQFCHGTKTTQAVNSFLASDKFMDALRVSVDGYLQDRRQGERSVFDDALSKWPGEPKPIIKKIVELRGHLRHHSLRHKDRWDPTKRAAFRNETGLIHRIALAVAFSLTDAALWKEPYLSRFLAMAEELHQTIVVRVIVTVKTDEMARDHAFDLKFPQRTPNLKLARIALDRILELVDEKAPRSELLAIRAVVKSNNVELFRFDVGPSLPR